MNIRIIFLPIKIGLLIGMLFSTSLEALLLMAGLLLLCILIPKAKSLLDLITFSGYMKSSAGIIYSVGEKNRAMAKSNGFTEINVFEAASLSNDDIPEWKPD